MSRFHIVRNAKTGETTQVPFTAEEEATRDAIEAAQPAPDTIDQEALNAALAEPGSVVRALAEIMLIEINKLRVKTGDAAYTRPQFVTALKARMR